jgi:amino-acid N-acetyltransferase
MPVVALHPVAGNLDYVESCLRQTNLPTQDLQTTPAEFYYATADGERIGVGGIEEYGRVGLLRSVAVEPSKQGHGYGSALCAALETTAQTNDIETLYVLTTTAAEFFTARGYDAIDRTTAPDAIEETTQFQNLCPSTATCMRKSL